MAEGFGSLLGGFAGGIVGGAVVRLFLDASQYHAALAKADAEGKTTTNSMGQGMSKFKMVATAAFVAAGIAAIKFAASAVQAAQQHEAAIQRLSVVAGANTAAFVALAAAQSKLTAFTQDDIIAAEGNLAVLHLTSNQMQTLLPLTEDYARFMGVDLPTAAGNLERAFQGNTRALKAIGITYKATGNAAQDFSNIVALIQQHVGGAAAAYLQTYAGKVEQLKTQFHEFQVTVGEQLIPALTKMLPLLSDILHIVTGMGPEIIALGVAFVAWKAFGFVPVLLNGIAVGLERIAYSLNSGIVLKLASGVEVLGGAVAGATFGTVALVTALALIPELPTDQKLQQLNQQIAELSVAFKRGSDVGMTFAQEVDFLTKAFGANQQAVTLALRTGMSYDAAVRQINLATRSGVVETEQMANSLAYQTQQSNAATAAMQAQKNAQDALTGGLVGLIGQRRQLATDQQAEAGLTGQKLKDQQLKVLQDQISLTAATQAYRDTLRKSGDTQKEAVKLLEKQGIQAGLTKTAVDELAASYANLFGTINTGTQGGGVGQLNHYLHQHVAT